MPSAASSRRQVAQHPTPGLLDLFEQRPALVLGPGDDRLGLCHRFGDDPLTVHASLLLCVGDQQLDLDDAFGGRRLGTRLQFVDLALRVAQERGRPFLGLDDDAGRFVVGVPEDLRAVLAERRRQGRLVDHRMGSPLLRLRQGRPQFLLAFLEPLQAPGHRLEVGAHLVGVEAPADDGKGVACDVSGRDPGG